MEIAKYRAYNFRGEAAILRRISPPVSREESADIFFFSDPDDINRGVVNILVGFAPLKPAEFVIIKIQQLAGQIEA